MYVCRLLEYWRDIDFFSETHQTPRSSRSPRSESAGTKIKQEQSSAAASVSSPSLLIVFRVCPAQEKSEGRVWRPLLGRSGGWGL